MLAILLKFAIHHSNSPLITGRFDGIEGEITSPNFWVTPRG